MKKQRKKKDGERKKNGGMEKEVIGHDTLSIGDWQSSKLLPAMVRYARGGLRSERKREREWERERVIK